MGLNAAGLNAVMAGGPDTVMYAAMGSGTTAGTQNSAQRRQVTLAQVGAVLSASNAPLAFTGTPDAACPYALLFSASSGGTFYGYDAVAGDQAYNADGEYDLTALTITGSSPT